MRKSLFLLIVSVLMMAFSIQTNAQISQGGTPLSFDKVPYTFSKHVPVQIMPAVDVNALRAEDLVLDQQKDIPWRFGQNIDVDIDLKTLGVSETIPGMGTLWRIDIVSPGALSINLLFDNFQIPPGATLFIYNQDRNDIIGAFTEFNNREDRIFATTLVRGEHITLEYFEPKYVPFSGELHISRVTHGYRGPEEFIKAFGSSGSCNVNVACPASAGMENQIKSSCMLVSGGSGFCSGALINNTANNGIPYVLSADHCYSNPSSVIYWFNWQSATCSNPGSSPSYNSISGATQRARNAATDFWLVELSSAPPSNYNVYYSGWNRTTDNNITGKIWGIHHPSGDIKKISWSTLGVSTTTLYGTSVPGDGTHWRITSWSDNTTTEPGSSGSPLYDPDGRIIGQLHGGSAACGNTLSDWYGKLGVSWTGGGTNATRLSNWLDPLGTAPTVIDGYDPNTPAYSIDAEMNAIITPASVYTAPQTITPQVTIKNNGANTLTSASVSYTLNGGAPVSTTWNGSLATGASTNVSFPSMNIVNGNHTFVATVTVTGDQVAGNNSLTRNFSVTDCGTSIPVPYNEVFNSAALPACWSEQITHATNNWTSTTGYLIGGTTPVNPQTGTYFWYVPWVAANQSELLITPSFNFSGTTNLELSFWFNGSYYWSVDPEDNCDLELLVRVNGGAWTILWDETDNTSFDANANYVWTQTTLNLSAYDGMNNIQFAFRYTGNDGANFAIDNVLISGIVTDTEGNQDLMEFEIFPNPSNDKFILNIGETAGSADFVTITDHSGKTVYSEIISNNQNLTISTESFAAGVYLVTLHTDSGKIVKKLIVQ